MEIAQGSFKSTRFGLVGGGACATDGLGSLALVSQKPRYQS